MVRMLVSADAENCILKNQINSKNQTPEQMDRNKKYEHYFNNIWDLAMNKADATFEKLYA